MSCSENAVTDRRGLLIGGGAAIAMWGMLPRLASASTRDPRFLTVILRGGLDGLSLAAPVGDPVYASLRQHIAMARPGETNGGLGLDGMFALNPNMPFLHWLYQKRQALVVHAVHTQYRERSHFDGQDVLESGLPGTGKGGEDGWLNRALANIEATGAVNRKGLALGAVVPLVIRGKAPVLSWIPKTYNLPLREATVTRLVELYTHTDPTLAQVMMDSVEVDGKARSAEASASSATTTEQAADTARLFRDFTEAAGMAARYLTQPDGPRIGALSYSGWDTHANEGVIKGALGNRLSGLDAAIKTLHDALGEVWQQTAILIVTEFGRTARVNGTNGTDHGMATCALLVGGAVNGGRVVADWPGLAEGQLHEGRDLKPTMDLRAVIKGVLRDHVGVPDRALGVDVFPDTATIKGTGGLVV